MKSDNRYRISDNDVRGQWTGGAKSGETRL